MVEAIGTIGGIALTAYDRRAPRRRPRALVRRAVATDAAERVEIEDALAAVDLEDERLDDIAPGDPLDLTVAAIARRLVAIGARAVPVQARLGPAAVCRLVRADG